MKNLSKLFITIIVLVMSFSCTKEDNPVPVTPPIISSVCNDMDVSKLTNKWWKNVKPSTQSVSYPSYYFNSNGKEHKQNPIDLTVSWNIGNWTLSCDTLKKFSPYSGNLTPNEVWIVVTLNDSMFSIKNLSPAISAGTIQTYRL